MTILVTGSTGFIGRNLVGKGLRGLRKILISRRGKNPFPGDPSIRFFRCDLRDPGDVRSVFRRFRIDAVIHLASAGVTPAPEGEIWETNVQGTFNLLETAAARGVRRFIHAGTCGVRIAPQVAKGVSSKNSWKLAYTLSKIAQAALVKEFNERHGLPAVNLRLYHVYGPQEHKRRLFPMILNAAISGKSVDLSPGRRKRDFVFVDDVVRSMDLAVNVPRFPRGRILDIATGEGLSIRRVVGVLRRKSYASEAFTPLFGKLLYYLTDVPTLVGDPKPAGRALRWRPRVNVSEGLDRMEAALRAGHLEDAVSKGSGR